MRNVTSLGDLTGETASTQNIIEFTNDRPFVDGLDEFPGHNRSTDHGNLIFAGIRNGHVLFLNPENMAIHYEKVTDTTDFMVAHDDDTDGVLTEVIEDTLGGLWPAKYHPAFNGAWDDEGIADWEKTVGPEKVAEVRAKVAQEG